MKLSFVGKIESQKDYAVCLLQGKDMEGDDAYKYMAIRHDEMIKLMDPQQRNDGIVDLRYAVVLKEGKGEPSEALKQEVVEYLGVDGCTVEEMEAFLQRYMRE